MENSNFAEMSEWYAEQSAMTQQLGSEYEQLASGIAGEMTSAFKSIIDGSKSAEQAMADMLQGIANQFLDMAMKILQDAITQQLMGLFGSLFGSSIGGFSGAPQMTSGTDYFGGGFTPMDFSLMVAAHLLASRQLLVNVALSCSCPMAPALLSAMRTSLLRLIQRSLAVALVMLTMTPWALPLGLVTAVQTVLQHLQRHAVPWQCCSAATASGL